MMGANKRHIGGECLQAELVGASLYVNTPESESNVPVLPCRLLT